MDGFFLRQKLFPTAPDVRQQRSATSLIKDNSCDTTPPSGRYIHNIDTKPLLRIGSAAPEDSPMNLDPTLSDSIELTRQAHSQRSQLSLESRLLSPHAVDNTSETLHSYMPEPSMSTPSLTSRRLATASGLAMPVPSPMQQCSLSEDAKPRIFSLTKPSKSLRQRLGAGRLASHCVFLAFLTLRCRLSGTSCLRRYPTRI